MIEQHDILGHRIALQLMEVQPHRYRWVWHIDGRHFSKGPVTWADEDAARSEALLYAWQAIERLEHHKAMAVP